MEQVTIKPGFWQHWTTINRQVSIFQQWEQLEASGCIDNFRILAEHKAVFREGWFFADSDAYKWLDAAARILQHHPDPRLSALVEKFIDLVRAAQDADGYLFTYNQVHFPGTRWSNLQIEHELYCHGHLIEAGISHFKATGQSGLLDCARLAAERILADFLGKGTRFTPGHEEIEIALLKLYELTGHAPYRQLAGQFIQQRGRDALFGLHLLIQERRTAARSRAVRKARAAFLLQHPDYTPPSLPPGNYAPRGPHARLRYLRSALSGRLLQQHTAVSAQVTPEGHAVRFAYLQTAVALYARLSNEPASLPGQEKLWAHMTARRMHISGGIGSFAETEGFGRDFQLDPEMAYAETCAALGSIFWNWELARVSRRPRYSDLLEWQLYNAALVGLGLDGRSYLYNNPLASRGGISRQAWFQVPCCPSNLSRTLASLEDHLSSIDEQGIYIHQYMDSHVNSASLGMVMESSFPWEGKVQIRLHRLPAGMRKICLRFPGWSPAARIWINGRLEKDQAHPAQGQQVPGGLDLGSAQWISLERPWMAGDTIEVLFEMPVKVRLGHPKTRELTGRIAVSRGPLLYCLESVDNPGMDVFSTPLNPATLEIQSAELGGMEIVGLAARSHQGDPLFLVPYCLWANRGPSSMNVWIPEEGM